MKIVHLCLSCFYIDNFSYQENELVAQNVADGHDVTVIASTESFGEDGKVVYVPPGKYLGTDGATVIRLPYRKWLPHKLMRKVRMHPGVYKLLEELAPDVILFHGTGGWELVTVSKYKERNPSVRLFVDSHTDANNSAKGWVSDLFLHKIFYRSILKRSLRNIERILCVNIDAMDFAQETYGIPRSLLEFYPLGGRIITSEEYEAIRSSVRQQYNIQSDELLFVQSGKMNSRKKIVDSLEAFSCERESNARFLLAGHVQEDVSISVNEIIEGDPRISYIGWLHPSELFDLLCAADVYVQPGTQSATMQMSLCAHCVVILDDVVSHHPYIEHNGWLVGGRMSLRQAFAAIMQVSRDDLQMMQNNSARLAERLLDYRNLAKRLYVS